MNPAVAARAKNLNVDAVALVVALVARACGSKNRAAARIAKAILGTRNRLPEIDALAAHLGLDTPNPAGFRKLLRSARDSRRRSSQN